MNLKKLQNGSDIRGVALEGIPGEPVNLSPEIVEKLAGAFVTWLKRNAPGEETLISVGMDSRISGPSLREAFIRGANQAGARVYDCGLASTPAMFMSTVIGEKSATASVMLTASHLPFNRNGIKFFTREGGLNKQDITAILEIAETGYPARSASVEEVRQLDLMDLYSRHLVNYIREGAEIKANPDKPLEGLKIIVDAGNGAGGFFATQVLLPLGADITGSQFLEPNGNFPNHIPNPEDPTAMKSICDAVTREGADLGIIFDTDVDRAAIVDAEGKPINRNSLIALISAIILTEHPGSTIVTDSITSEGLTRFIEEDLKGRHHRFKRGYKNVINESIRLNSDGRESWLAIETSGHAALKENFFLDDGAFLVSKLLVEAAKMHQKGESLTSLISSLSQPTESEELRISITHENDLDYGNRVLAKMNELCSQVQGWEIMRPNYEGIRVRCLNADEQGWFLLRMSLHDPVMPLNLESEINGGVQNIRRKLKEMLEGFEGLNLPV